MSIVSHIVPADFKAKLDVVTAKCMTIRKYSQCNYMKDYNNDQLTAQQITDGADQCETTFLTVSCYLEVDPDVNISSWFDNDRES